MKNFTIVVQYRTPTDNPKMPKRVWSTYIRAASAVEAAWMARGALTADAGTDGAPSPDWVVRVRALASGAEAEE